MKIPNTPSQIPNALSHEAKTPFQFQRHQVHQPKQQVRQPKCHIRSILNHVVFSRGNFCHKFTHFSGIEFSGQNMWWRTKNDKYEVCQWLAENISLLQNPSVQKLISSKIKHCQKFQQKPVWTIWQNIPYILNINYPDQIPNDDVLLINYTYYYHCCYLERF